MNCFILTGASHGIGEAIAKKLLSNNNHLICVSRTKNEALLSLANSEKHRMDYFEFDLNHVEELDTLMRNILEKISPDVDALYLINNAAIVFNQPIEEIDPSAIARLLTINLVAPMILTSSFIKYSKPLNVEKRMLNVSSGSSFNLSPGGSCYSTSKAGLETFTKSIGIEQSDVKIMAVRPNMVDTAMHAATVNKKNLKSPEYAADRILTFLLERFEHGKIVKAW
ncbi:SDR family NAD(P)-dependent oxidoreductase [Paenibacillus radicis (ex Gao et al. 2016)]|uniref:Short-chain dehydrogenase n=1 Tax=Paenibacillus radicis (ex Gao et al. 2016) TaxID=1737354 RepID=A0A917H7I7_9BACL|nr:SDR family NAD(P)-dependent oxidoreductase [Paenibacillus radicis (ex Gao et al. 2016)]GGG69956.1 short-chain dehydrogenase [Paenibacillus radicis (ex Gao et al. 2016)]